MTVCPGNLQGPGPKERLEPHSFCHQEPHSGWGGSSLHKEWGRGEQQDQLELGI